MRERLILRFILLALAVLAASQLYARTSHAAVAGFERMGAPRDPDARAAAEARVLEVYDAIDQATDDPEIRRWMRWRCKRESWCNWYGEAEVHKGDASLGRQRWRRAKAKGLIHPETCEEHQLGEERGWWSTVGPFGNVSAYVIRHAGECVSPRAMVDPYVAADLAVAHLGVLCRRHGACTCEGWARWWAGPGRWAQRDRLDRLHVLVSQCGPVPTYRWAWAALVDAVAWLEETSAALEDAADEYESVAA